MKKPMAVALVVAAFLGGAEPTAAEAERGRVKADVELPTDFEVFARDLGQAFLRDTKADDKALDAKGRRIAKSVKKGFVTPEEALAQVVLAVLDRYAELNLRLVRHSGDWRRRVEEVKATDPEAAAAAVEAGLGTPQDVVRADEASAVANCRESTAGSMARVQKECAAAGFPFSYATGPDRWGNFGDVVALGESPLDFGMPVRGAVATCDGRIRVIATDISIGQGVDTSYLQFVGPDSPAVAVEFALTSDADFSVDAPRDFVASGLAPGRYVVRAGVLIDGNRIALYELAVVVPEWDVADAAPPHGSDLTGAAVNLGFLLTNETKATGKDLERELRDIAQKEVWRQMTPEQRLRAGLVAFTDAERDFEASRRDSLDEYLGLWGDLRTSDPDAADREIAPGAALSGDRLHASLRTAAQIGYGSTLKAATTLRKALAKAGSPIAVVVPAPGEPAHPVVEGIFGIAPQGGVLLAVADSVGDGRISLIMRDPFEDQVTDESAVRISNSLGIDFDPVIERRMRSGIDFPGGAPAAVEFTGLAPGTYVIRTGAVTGGGFTARDFVTITVPGASDSEPPLPCTGTTAEFLVAGQPVFVPPLDRFRMFTSGNTLLEMYVSFRNPLSSSIPSVNLDISPVTPIDLDGPDGIEMTVTIPPFTTTARAYVYNAATQQTMQMTSGTYVLRDLRKLRQAGGCAEVTLSGTMSDMRTVSGRYTLSADDLMP